MTGHQPGNGAALIDGLAAMERIIHLHIPMTAGNSLRTAMELCANRKLRIYPHWQEENYHSFSPDDYDFYSGHIGFNTASRIGGQMVSVFRHPVDRFISVYYYWKHLHDTGAEVRQATILANKYSLEQFARIRDVFALTEELNNRMTLQVAYGTSEHHRELLRTRGLTDEDIYQMAVENIGAFAVIGTQENMVDFGRTIKNRFDVDISLDVFNQNDERISRDDVSFSTKSRILEWVYMDMELYDHVLHLCRDREDAARTAPAPVLVSVTPPPPLSAEAPLTDGPVVPPPVPAAPLPSPAGLPPVAAAARGKGRRKPAKPIAEPEVVVAARSSGRDQAAHRRVDKTRRS